MPGELPYIKSTYRSMVVFPSMDGSEPVYGKQWEITSCSNQNLVGKVVTVVRTGERWDSCDTLMGEKLMKFDRKYLKINETDYIWKKRTNQPLKIKTSEERMDDGAYRYRLSEEGASQLEASSPIAAEFLHCDTRGLFLQLRNHPRDSQQRRIGHPDGKRYFECLRLERKRIYIPGIAETSSSMVRLAIEQIKVSS